MEKGKVYVYAEKVTNEETVKYYGYAVMPLQQRLLGVVDANGKVRNSKVAGIDEKFVVQTSFVAINIDDCEEFLTFSTTDEYFVEKVTEHEIKFDDFEAFEAAGRLENYKAIYC